ncbi:hypothetical protein [Intestinibacter sp.]|uniref:hypothetical protein n=1 Tax=Intestinibacter sp. TaxID=1965304 RepID=UPI003F17374D
MLKKYLSIILSMLIVLNCSLTVFAEETNYQKNISDKGNIDIDLLVSREISDTERKQIEDELKVLSLYGENLDEIIKININGGKYVYIVKSFDDDLLSELSVTKNEEGLQQLNIKEGEKEDTVLKKEGDLYIDGEKIIVESSVSISDNDTQIMPLADRDRWVTNACPYGKSSDYSKYIGVRTNPDIKLGKMLEEYTRKGLAKALIHGISASLGLSGIAESIVNSSCDRAADKLLDKAFGSYKNTKYLSSKTYIYYHGTQGHYIESKNMMVEKDNIRWYYGRYTKDSDKGPLSTEYVCTRYY